MKKYEKANICAECFPFELNLALENQSDIIFIYQKHFLHLKVIHIMRKQLITLTTLATLALGISACSTVDENENSTAQTTSAQSNNAPSTPAEATQTEKSKEPEDSNTEANLEERKQAAALVNLFLGTMGANTLYNEQIIDREKDEELFDVMGENEDIKKLVSIARSGETLFMEPVDYENMSDTEIYDYIQANFRNSALYAQENATSEQPLEITVSADNFYELDNGDMVFLDYPKEEFLEKEKISSISEYDVNTDKDKTDIVLKKVGDKWKIHESFVKTYVKGMKNSDIKVF